MFLPCRRKVNEIHGSESKLLCLLTLEPLAAPLQTDTYLTAELRFCFENGKRQLLAYRLACLIFKNFTEVFQSIFNRMHTMNCAYVDLVSPRVGNIAILSRFCWQGTVLPHPAGATSARGCYGFFCVHSWKDGVYYY